MGSNTKSLSFLVVLSLIISIINVNSFTLDDTCYDSDSLDSAACCASLQAQCEIEEGVTDFNCTPRYDPLTNNASVAILKMSKCELYGTIPSTLTQMTKLTILDLSNNYLVSTIPSDIGNIGNVLGGLTYLDLSSNQLNGSIPKSISEATNIEYIDFSQNELTRMNIQEIVILEKLKHLDLSDNDIVETFHETFGNLLDIEYLDLSINRIQGELPSTLADMTKLVEFNMERNDISGPIPPEIAEMPSLRSLNLADNKLTGSVPETFAIFWEDNPLNILYLGDNDLDCPVSDYSAYGVLNDFNTSYGTDGESNCYTPDNGGGSSSSGGLDGVEVAIIVIFVIVALGAAIYLFQRTRSKRAEQIRMLNSNDAFEE